MLPDHISSDQPKNGVIVKIVIELLDTRLTFIFQYVKELIRRSEQADVLDLNQTIHRTESHLRTVEDIGVEPMTLSLQS